MSHPLDNMVWEALGGPQFRMGATDGIVRHFDPTIAMFAAVADPWSADFATLPSGHSFGFVTTDHVPFPAAFEIQREAVFTQMIAEHPRLPSPADNLVALTDAHAPQMLALAELTKPGPFAARTNRMGKYWGVLDGDRLVAMAGERLRLTGFCEVSAVCTHPDYRGRGYAKALMAKVIAGIVARSETPFLQVLPDNAGAIALYESLGFTARRDLTFTVVRRR
jgi:ribosomal protein S18 acetylase RimI-like enzyme